MEWENGGGFRGETGCQVFLSISTCRLQTRENWNGLLRGCPKRSIPSESPGDSGRENADHFQGVGFPCAFCGPLFILMSIFSSSAPCVSLYSSPAMLYFPLYTGDSSLTRSIDSLTFILALHLTRDVLSIIRPVHLSKTEGKKENRKQERSLLVKAIRLSQF